jgi:hypothetical protein
VEVNCDAKPGLRDAVSVKIAERFWSYAVPHAF